jgi:hypothetical protein
MVETLDSAKAYLDDVERQLPKEASEEFLLVIEQFKNGRSVQHS